MLEGWARVREHCGACGFEFERESGFWIGAMIINTIAAFSPILVVFVGGWIVFWPDVPWTGILVVTVLLAVATPVLAFPVSRTLWSAIEMSYHQVEPAERERAATNLETNADGGDPRRSGG